MEEGNLQAEKEEKEGAGGENGMDGGEGKKNDPGRGFIAGNTTDQGAENVKNLFDIADSLLEAVSQEAEDSIRAATPFNSTAKTIYSAGGNDTNLEDLPTLNLLESCLLDVHRVQQQSLNERRRMQRDLLAKNFSFAELGKSVSKTPPRPKSRDPNLDYATQTIGARPGTGQSSRLLSSRGEFSRPGTGSAASMQSSRNSTLRPSSRPGTGQSRGLLSGRPGSPIQTSSRPMSPSRVQQVAIFEDEVSEEKFMGETYRAKFRETFPAPTDVEDHEWGERAHLREIPAERELRYKDDDTMSNLSMSSLQGGSRFTLRNRIRKMVVGETRGGGRGPVGMETSRTSATTARTDQEEDESSLTPSERVMIEWEKKQNEKHKPRLKPPKVPEEQLQELQELEEKGGTKNIRRTHSDLRGSQSAGTLLPGQTKGKGAPKRVRFRGRIGSAPDTQVPDAPKSRKEERPNLSIFSKPEEPETLQEPPVVVTNNKAKQILKEFKEEVQKWKETVGAMNTNTPSQDKALQSFSDHLTDKYLCRQLDPLPSSETVKDIRKQVVMEIESIAGNKQKQANDENPKPGGPMGKSRRASSKGNPKRTPNPKAAIAGGWECSLCHKMNFPQHEACAVCRRKKGYRPMVNQALVKRTMFKQAQTTLDNSGNNVSKKGSTQNSPAKDSLSQFMAEQDIDAKANDLDSLSRDIRNVIDGIRSQESLKAVADRKQNMQRGMAL